MTINEIPDEYYLAVCLQASANHMKPNEYLLVLEEDLDSIYSDSPMDPESKEHDALVRSAFKTRPTVLEYFAFLLKSARSNQHRSS